MLKLEKIEPVQPADMSVILLHGLGANGYDLMSLVPLFDLPQNHTIRFIFPHAPPRPITINNGYVMPGWYDIGGFSQDSREDLAGLQQSRQQVENLVEQEIKSDIPAERIILGGFSQGGALTLFTGLQSAHQFAGLIVLSAYLPCQTFLEGHRVKENTATPIFMAHGAQDPMVPYQWGMQAKQKLEQWSYRVSWHDYPIQHAICEAEIQAIGAFILKLM
jgi:phospholipase/carboxylesterase